MRELLVTVETLRREEKRCAVEGQRSVAVAPMRCGGGEMPRYCWDGAKDCSGGVADPASSMTWVCRSHLDLPGELARLLAASE